MHLLFSYILITKNNYKKTETVNFLNMDLLTGEGDVVSSVMSDSQLIQSLADHQ